MNVGNFKPFVWPGPTRSCGYVAIPKESFLFGVARDALSDVFRVNGGFTFAGAGERDEYGTYVVGWDYTRAFNYRDGSVDVSDGDVLIEATRCAGEMNAFDCRRIGFCYMSGRFFARRLFFPKKTVITVELAPDVDVMRILEMIDVDRASDIWTWGYYSGSSPRFMVDPKGWKLFSLYIDIAGCEQVVKQKVEEILEVVRD